MNAEIKEAIDRYTKFGLQPGGFIEAVLGNDLMSTFSRADENNLADLKEIVAYIREDVPIGARGTIQKVSQWIKDGGIHGLSGAKQR